MREDDLRRVMARISVQGLGRRTSKGWINAPCPLAQWTHKNGADRSPSFGVMVNDTGRSTFNCYGCKQKGTIAQLVRKLEAYRQVSYGDTMERVQQVEVAGFIVPDFEAYNYEDQTPPEPIEAAIWDGMFDKIEDTPEAIEFLKKRRVNRAAVEKAGLEFDPETRRIVFPVKGAAGELYGFSGRAIWDSKIKVKDYAELPKRWLILGRERWVEGKPVLLVEGLMAYARMLTINADDLFNVGAVLGSVLTQQKADMLSEFGHGVYLLFDPDKAGDDGIYGPADENGVRDIKEGAIGRLWGQVPIFVPEYPKGVDDVDDLSFEQVAAMRSDTPLYSPDPATLKALKVPR